jgi:hypothetical protein
MTALRIGVCAHCNAELRQRATGRPRRYCSDRCRSAARRRRAGQGEGWDLSIAGVTLTPEAADVSPLEIVGLSADPDEAVLQAVMNARALAAAFGIVSSAARPQFAWRCEAMADHIAAGLKKWFVFEGGA